jgi:hypothetical protein
MKLKRILLILSIPLINLISVGQVTRSDVNTGVLHAGMAKIDITPSIPVKLYGYSARKTYSESIHDPLSARAVIFENSVINSYWFQLTWDRLEARHSLLLKRAYWINSV